MRASTHPNALRVAAALGPSFTVVEFEESTHTAQEAADAIGCTVAEIAKSILFRSQSGRPVLIVASGTNKVDEKKFHDMADNFLSYMMRNFETELTVMGSRIALTTYDLPFKPTKLKHFDEFHSKFGKYVLQAQS